MIAKRKHGSYEKNKEKYTKKRKQNWAFTDRKRNPGTGYKPGTSKRQNDDNWVCIALF